MKGILRYAIVILLMSMLRPGIACAQKQFNVLDWKTDVTLNTYLVQQMQALYEARRKEFESALKSKQSAAAYIGKVGAKAIKLFGSPPQKSPLNATITGTIQKDGYRIEKIFYE